MPFIYEPRGKAGEYARLALNHYTGCAHRCVYCYAPDILHMTREQFARPAPRRGVLEGLRREIPLLRGNTDEVLMCFTTDPYQPLEEREELTRAIIKMMIDNDVAFSILTKNGGLAIRDFDLLKRARCSFGVTLTVANEKDRQIWEPHAGTVFDRKEALFRAHQAGIRTWVSLEPVLIPADTLALIEECRDFVDHWKVGKINYHPRENEIDWSQFKASVVHLLEDHHLDYYIKNSLRPY